MEEIITLTEANRKLNEDIEFQRSMSRSLDVSVNILCSSHHYNYLLREFMRKQDKLKNCKNNLEHKA